MKSPTSVGGRHYYLYCWPRQGPTQLQPLVLAGATQDVGGQASCKKVYLPAITR